MDNSILSTKYIFSALDNNEALKELGLEGKIFPLLAQLIVNPDTGEEEDITFPFIVYSRTSLTPTYTKDNLTENDVTMQIVCVSDDYVNSLDVANAVRNALECKGASVDGMTIYPIKMESITESTMEDAYIQTLTFQYKVK